MALTGLDIYKLLPRTNCKKCGSPTCLAFAMRLATKKGSLDECPDVSPQAREALAAASEPPIRLITIGSCDAKFEIGGETVLFRHDKTFYHQTALAITLNDSLDAKAQEARIEAQEVLRFERMGMVLKVDMIAVLNSSKDKAKFVEATKRASQSSLTLLLVSEEPSTLDEALAVSAKYRPLIYAANLANYEAMVSLAKRHQVPLAVYGKDLDDLDSLVGKIMGLGYKDLVLDPGSRNLANCLNDFTQIRRLALKKNYRPMGFPVIGWCDAGPERLACAATAIAKYAGIVVLDTVDPHEIYALLTLRLNIYTDPQKPITVEPKVYEIGAVNENSPLLVTTNFSLTYYSVHPEIESSGVPAYLLICDSEGMSVLTAWAAEKFTPETIAKALKASGIEGRLKHKKLIIPGYVAVMSGRLEDESGWKVLVGPKEATGISKFLKEIWQ